MGTRFPILFTGLNKTMSLLGLAPRWCWAELDAERLTVHMSWAFRATIDRSAMRSVEPYDGRILGWGVHGFRGRWLVNGSSKGLVRIAIDPPQRANVLGVPIKLRELMVSIDGRDEFIAALVPRGA
ncbi:MAG: hypothetical protein AB7V43_05630 [Acidimicrobiia bacterium]